ncbi:MAG: hypothetical protein K2W95_32510 [Candidatus Obscuribacterales bacterium]|nr:hypothetical protein [Candidatus Obscuribacterales bacterium]MBY0552052.1 hypothetical protein [Candidatus Obscuribacterales bacterium]
MADKNTIGPTDENRQIIESLLQTDLFSDMMDIAKFAIAYAIKSGVQPTDSPSGSTMWNVGSFDRDGQLKLTIQSMFTTETPYRAAESLMNTGLGMIKALPRRDDVDILALMK